MNDQESRDLGGLIDHFTRASWMAVKSAVLSSSPPDTPPDILHMRLAAATVEAFLGDRWLEHWRRRRFLPLPPGDLRRLEEAWFITRLALAILDVSCDPGVKAKLPSWRGDLRAMVGTEAELCVAASLKGTGADIKFLGESAQGGKNYDLDATLGEGTFAVEVKGLDASVAKTASSIEKLVKKARSQLMTASPGRSKVVALRANVGQAYDAESIGSRLTDYVEKHSDVDALCVFAPAIASTPEGWSWYEDRVMAIPTGRGRVSLERALIEMRAAPNMDLWSYNNRDWSAI